MGGGEGGHFQDAPGRLGADDFATVEQEFVLQGAGRVAQPLDAQTTEHAVEDHGEEVVDERGVPFFEELAFEIAVVGDEFLAAHLRDRQRRGGERGVEADLEAGDLFRQAGELADEADAGADEGEGVGEAAAGVFRDDFLDDFIRQRLADAHHLLHESTVELEAGEQGEDAIPANQIVINPAADEPEHLRKDVFGALDAVGRHGHELAEFAVGGFVDPAGEGECERRGDAAVAFGDVAVIPDAEGVGGIGREAERGDGAGLEQPEFSGCVDGPLDVLRPAAGGFALAGEGGNGDGVGD